MNKIKCKEITLFIPAIVMILLTVFLCSCSNIKINYIFKTEEPAVSPVPAASIPDSTALPATDMPTDEIAPSPTIEPTSEPTPELTPEPTAAPVLPDWEGPYRLAINPGSNSFSAGAYPYYLDTPSAIYYLSQTDIDAMGEAKFFEGLKKVALYQEQDFEEAKDYMKDRLPGEPGEIPKITIQTDFQKTTEFALKSNMVAAYYNNTIKRILLFGDWEMVCHSLLHEYVHYLCDVYTVLKVDGFMWSEGMAEYVSMFACKNQLYKSNNYGYNQEDIEYLKQSGFWDDEKDCLDVKKIYRFNAFTVSSPEFIGFTYFAVCGAECEMTKQQQEHPMMSYLSYYEAVCFFDYMIERFGIEKVFSNMNVYSSDMKEAYGFEFEELYSDFKEDLSRKLKDFI